MSKLGRETVVKYGAGNVQRACFHLNKEGGTIESATLQYSMLILPIYFCITVTAWSAAMINFALQLQR
jgi:hypothetical protein